MDKPLVGISSCLLGENVRYDGGHQLDRYLRDTLGQYVEFVPVCPEVESGMAVPREAMRLVEVNGSIRLMTRKTGIDMTGQMEDWIPKKLAELARLPLCGFIFKAKSPSSGLKRVKVYRDNKLVRANAAGIFAGRFAASFPNIPLEEDGRLHDAKLRENFIERIFVMQRWRDLVSADRSLGGLVRFHASHKYLLMAHSQDSLKQMGVLVASGRKQTLDKLYADYLDMLTNALERIATVRKNTNVLMHIMGYFKKQLDKDEKQELTELIERYHSQLVPLVVPLTLINHYVRKHRPSYLLDQVYLNPHPAELMLRNHV